ncbi:MAG: C25 family cysteine peptidase [Thermoplasmatota archaeon]
MRPGTPSLLVVWSLLLAGLFMMLPASSEGAPDKTAPEGRTIEIDLGTPDFEVRERWLDGRLWSTIELADGLNPPTKGEPALPVISHPLEVPYEVLDIHLLRSDPVSMRLPYKLPPSPTALPLTEENLKSSSPVEPDWDRYSSGEVFPARPLLWKHTGWGWEDGQRLGHYSISVSPFDYDPGSDRLTFYGNVRILLEVGEAEPTLASDTQPTRGEVRAPTPPPHVKEGTELLVITYDSYLNELDPYVEWNREKGVCVSIVTISQVNGQFPQDDQATSIWKYVHDTYFGDEQNLKFLLLVGEHNVVASRTVKDLDPYAPAGEPSTLHTDTYFGCLDNGYTNYNADGDSNWGEVNDIRDYIPEVYVSRIAVNSETEAKGWAAKAVAYERDVPVGGWAGTAALLGSYTHEYDDGPTHCEYLWNSHMEPVYATPDRYYSNGNVRSSSGAKLLTYSNFQSGLNDGLSIIVYMGHGHWAVWTEGPQDNPAYLYDSSPAAQLQQSPKLPFISAMSCETNWFDDSHESISEAFTENGKGGAISYAGAIRTTEGVIGYGYAPGAPGIQEDTLRMLKQGYRTPAEVFQRAKAYYADRWGAYFDQVQYTFNAWMEHQILGPPNVDLWTSTPKTFNVQYEVEEDYYSNITVNVRDGQNNAVKDARVTVYSATLEERSYVHTDGYGRAIVPFRISETAYGKITVTKDNFKPYQKEFVLRDRTEPETKPTCARPNPDGANGWYVSDPLLYFECSEPAEIFYKWNGGYVEEYRGGYMQVPEGSNTLEFWGLDSSGNEEDRKFMTVKYDPDTPVASVTIDPAEPDGESGWYITQPVVTIHLEESHGSPQRIDYWFGRDARQTSNGTIYPPQGDNDLHMIAVDEAGNRGEEMTFHFKVDSIKPTTEVSTGGIDPNERGWYVTPMTLTLSSDDRRSYIYYRWGDDGDFTKYSDSLTPPSGNNTLYYFAEDDHGNIEPLRTFRVPYDILPPDLELKITPGSPDGESRWYITRPRVVLEVAFEDNDYSIFYYLEGEEPREYLSPIDIPEGQWTLYAYAEDEAGNRGITQSHEFKVDTSSDPTQDYIDLSTNEEGWYTDLPQVILSTSDDAEIYYSWEGYTNYEKYSGGLYPPGDEGIFNLIYYSVDLAGNRESQKYLTLPIDSRPPEVRVVAPGSVDEGKEVVFDLTGTTDGVTVDAYFIDFGDGTDSGWVLTPKVAHAYGSSGSYEVLVKARDGVGHESDEVSLKLEVNSEVNMTLLLIIGGSALFLVLILVVAAAVVIRSRRHHHYAHHSIHIHPLHPLPGHPPKGPHSASGLQPSQGGRKLPPATVPAGTKKAVAKPPENKPNPKARAPVDIPKPPTRPVIPEPPRPPI